MVLGLLALLCLAPASLAIRLQSPADASAGDFWPSGHGKVGRYGSSPFTGPTNLSSAFLWSWHHPEGRFHTLPYGTAIDSERNIYLTTDTAIWKLSPEGSALWSFVPTPKATIFSAGSLLDGRIHFTTLDGRFFAVDMATGKEVWSRKVCPAINYDNGFVAAHEGVVVAATNSENTTHSELVRALRAEDGAELWSFKPSNGLWNFMALFPGDGTVLYQDDTGKAYRHRLESGELLWSAGGTPGSWTDGTPTLADGLLYTVAADMNLGARIPGTVRAHRVEDGQVMWEVKTPMPPNNAPAVGRLPGKSSLSLIQPGGWQGMMGGPTGIFAYDAKTGEKQWTFLGPSQKMPQQAGAAQGMLERYLSGATLTYVTNPWSAAIIDANGTVYAGHEDGLFFALHDANGDGKVEGPNEVSTFDTGAAFVGSSSPAMAPGLLAVASCDSLFVFKASA